jgi:hypothetical protein
MPPVGCPGEQIIPGLMGKFSAVEFVKMPDKTGIIDSILRAFLVLHLLQIGCIHHE